MWDVAPALLIFAAAGWFAYDGIADWYRKRRDQKIWKEQYRSPAKPLISTKSDLQRIADSLERLVQLMEEE